MTRRELNLAIFTGTADGVLWQPRLETWIGHHRAKGSLPERYRSLDGLGIYDALRCSVRYAACAGIETLTDRMDMVTVQEQHPAHLVSRVRTPAGEIATVFQEVWEDDKVVNRRIAHYPASTPEHLRVVTDLVNRTGYRADTEAFRRAAAAVGHRGEPTIFLNSSGFTQLIKTWCGLENMFYLLHDCPDAVEEYVEACDRRDDRQLDAALKLPCRIFNLGDHATNEFTPPPIMRRFLIPRWQKTAARLHAAGRFVHSHWDGNSRKILPLIRDSHLDGVEALTPAPMADMSLEMIKDAVGDTMVVLDLIPAIDFLPSRAVKDVLEFTRRVVDAFAPRLVLGISDEISQVGEIEKVEAITELLDREYGLPE